MKKTHEIPVRVAQANAAASADQSIKHLQDVIAGLQSELHLPHTTPDRADQIGREIAQARLEISRYSSPEYRNERALDVLDGYDPTA